MQAVANVPLPGLANMLQPPVGVQPADVPQQAAQLQWFFTLLQQLSAVQAQQAPLLAQPVPHVPVVLQAPPRRRRRQADSVNVARQAVFDPSTVAGRHINARKRHEVGRMEVECPHCGALHWIEERVLKYGRRSPRFGMCCTWRGKFSLPLQQEPPEPLKSLLTEQTATAREFRQKIRAYNSALQLASSGLAVDERFAGGAVLLMPWHCMTVQVSSHEKSVFDIMQWLQLAHLMDSFTFFVLNSFICFVRRGVQFQGAWVSVPHDWSLAARGAAAPQIRAAVYP